MRLVLIPPSAFLFGAMILSHFALGMLHALSYR
jgi:hypothetical protein